MTATIDRVTLQQLRNEALVRAHEERLAATREADVAYSETLAKLRDRFEADLAAARALHREAVRPAHRAYNRAVQEAERAYLTATHR
jgi:hypothetical protein